MNEARIAFGVLLLGSFVAGPLTGAAGRHSTITGYVIDSSCTFTKDLKKPISRECAVACAKAGSPLVIQADSGTIYLPISADHPAGGQNEKLISFAGEHVTVTGTVYAKGGAHALVIEKIDRAQSGK